MTLSINARNPKAHTKHSKHTYHSLWGPSNVTMISVYLLNELTGLFLRVEDLIVKDGEVECESESERVVGAHLALAYLKRLLVCLLTVMHKRYK